METQNITLSIPKDILLKVKMIAAKQNSSISGLLTRALTEIITQEEGYQAARRRHLAILEEKFNLETHGAVSWARGDLHER
jgi:hypothetical protein